MKPKHLFHKTLLRLAAQYTLLLFVLFTVFSGAVYLFADRTFGGDYQSSLQASNSETSDSALDRLRNILLITDASLILVLPLVSYQLAKRAIVPIQKSYEEQQSFVNDASHELRTPLSIVQGELELAIQKKRSHVEYARAIKTSLEEVHSLNDLVADLLLIARGSQADVKRSFVAVNLDEIVQDCVHSYKQLYTAQGLHFELSTTHGLKVNGSPELLYRCVANVLDNACKYSKHGDTIEITVDRKDDFARIQITDYGIGMSSEDVRSVYKRFWRADEARAIKGHGLGLAIVRQIIELHHGKIDMQSVKDTGTTATILLPD